MINDVIISYNNDYTEENRWFFETCADESRQFAVNNNLTHKIIVPPQLSAEEVKRNIESCENGFVFLAYMHGHTKGIVNESGDDIVSDTVNPELFGGNVFYTFSCQCGNELKDELLRRNTALFWGYKNDTTISPLDEFVECAVEGIKQFLAGKTVEDAKKAMEDKYIENSYKIGGVMGALLLENKDNMVVIGDMSATINDFPQW